MLTQISAAVQAYEWRILRVGGVLAVLGVHIPASRYPLLTRLRAVGLYRHHGSGADDLRANVVVAWHKTMDRSTL